MEPKVVRCKFKCVSASPGPAPFAAGFEPVVGGSPENESFFAATPGGLLRLEVLREQHFEPGREYFIDISPAPVPAEGTAPPAAEATAPPPAKKKPSAG